MTGSFVHMEVSCSIGQLYAGKMTIDRHSCVLLGLSRASELVFLIQVQRKYVESYFANVLAKFTTNNAGSDITQS